MILLAGDLSYGLLEVVNKAGVVGLLVAFAAGLLTEKIVPGKRLRESEKREEEWKYMALRGTALASRLTEYKTGTPIVPEERLP